MNIQGMQYLSLGDRFVYDPNWGYSGDLSTESSDSLQQFTTNFNLLVVK